MEWTKFAIIFLNLALVVQWLVICHLESKIRKISKIDARLNILVSILCIFMRDKDFPTEDRLVEHGFLEKDHLTVQNVSLLRKFVQAYNEQSKTNEEKIAQC